MLRTKMGLLQKIFRRTDSLTLVRRAVEQGRWADAIADGEGLDPTSLPPGDRSELEELLTKAGDALAELNLIEGEACLDAGEKARAKEHYSLAAGHARSAELKRRAGEALDQLQTAEPLFIRPAAATACCTLGCSSSAVEAGPDTDTTPFFEDLDPEGRMELIRAAYPTEWAERYCDLYDPLREAILLAHEGRDGEALACFDRVSPQDRDAVYWYEHGILLERMGDIAQARRDLEEVLSLHPGHVLAMEALVGVTLAGGEEEMAEKMLREMLDAGIAEPFSHGLLAGILTRRGDTEAALRHGLAAVEKGSREPTTLLLAGSLLEAEGRLTEAERLLTRLSTGGCGGGINWVLAEFWLRNGNKLDRALEVFKAALRQEPENPRWRLRIAQVYLAQGWTKEGIPLLEQALSDPHLDPELGRQGSEELRRYTECEK
jgi:tetratricopeptide (TPR) repeat protein